MNSNESAATARSVASVVPWEQVCRMLDMVQNGIREKKKEMLLKFVVQYRELLKKNITLPNDSFFPVLRILLPGLDRDRGAYGVKEKKLAELYIRILGLRKESVDAHKLLNYRKPKSGGGGEGDFADIAFYVLKSRCPEKGTLSLDEVDRHLTNIAENYASKNHDIVEKSVLQMLRKMTANEQKWLIRVLLKDMHLGLGQTSIFNAWHPDAKDYYDVTNSLLKVCATLRDPNVRLHEIEVALFSPFRPMLADRAILDKVESQMKHKTFLVENKFDGERSQIHKNGNQYKYFSRNGFDFSSNFGTDSSNGLFTPHIHHLFPSHVKNVILDGEMVTWSKKYKTIITKGEHLDVKNLKEGGDWQVCFCAFDILYLNGSVLTNLPLHERLEKLKTVLNPLEGRVVITTQTRATSKDDVVLALNEAIDNREEGVVLKDPDSVYQPASRRAGWIKVKPDYVDALIPELDMLIIGGYYGTGRRRGIMSHFLLACAVTNPIAGSRPSAFHSVGKVGSGYSVAELEDLIAKLSKNTTSKQPPNVSIVREKPDIWITPEKSCVVQVRAAEIVKTNVYKTGLTLRFPRVEKIRTDKSWYEVLTTEELEQLSQEASGKIANKYDNSSETISPKKKILKQSRHPSLPEYFRPADISKVTQKGDLFSGKEFCVITGGNGFSKHQIETLIAEHGGTFSQHPGESTYCIICESITIRVQNFINSELYNVVKPSWILECIKASKVLAWSPIHVFYLLKENAKQMAQEFDEFGDSFFSKIDGENLKCIMQGMTDNAHFGRTSLDQIWEFDLLTTEPGDLRSLFRRVKAFITSNGETVDESQDVLALQLRLYGATLLSTLNEDTTHIIVPKLSNIILQPSKFPGIHIVTENWITKSIQEGKLLQERIYMPH